MIRFDDALRFAIDAHAGMTRKIGNTPYILHPLEVATIAATMTSDVDVLCACVLHDVVEDTPHTLDEISTAFGPRVAELVAAETEDKNRKRPASETWLDRKQRSLDELRALNDRDVNILWLSDKLSNTRSLARLHLKEGDEMWKRFNQQDTSLQAWYYHEVADATSDLREYPAWQEYCALVKLIFEEDE